MLQARDFMHTDVHSVDPGMPMRELEEAFAHHGTSGFPVVDGERLVGVVSRSDVVRRLGIERSIAGQVSAFYVESELGESHAGRTLSEEAAEAGVRLAECTVADVMSAPAVSVSVDASVTTLARTMIERRIHRLPIVDGERLAGVVSSVDVVRLVAEGALVPSERGGGSGGR